MKNRKQKAIDKILSNFDFERVHTVMVMLNWKWTFTNGVPTIQDLRSEAIELLNNVAIHKYSTSRDYTGHFIAKREDNCLRLEFNIAFCEEVI